MHPSGAILIQKYLVNIVEMGDMFMALVLVVEDEPGIRMVLDLSLTGEGHQVETLKNGLLARDRLTHSPLPDILIADLNLPGLSGSCLVEYVHAHPDLRNIPVILMTGGIPDLISLPSDHFNVILEKPFDLDELNGYVGLLTQ